MANALNRQKRINRGFYVPAPQRARIVQARVRGDSISEIARNESRNWDTVRRILNAEQQQEYVQAKRAELVGAADVALNALFEGLTSAKDRAWLALEVLRAIGVIQAPVTKHAVAIAQTSATPPQLSNNPAPQEMLANPRLMEIAHSAAIVGVLRSQIYGTALPELDETEVKRAEGMTKNLIANSAAEGPEMD